ncbi:MAG: lysylphosphatidylglycerol synthase transmembrane domain-containing protein, partial [Chloroflexia bacterium]
VRWLPFTLMLVPYVLTFLTKVWRWRVLFHPDEARTPFGLLFSTLMISYIPLPFRLGEVARGAVASARSGIPAPRVFSTILVEKVLDVLTLLLLLGISLPFVPLPRDFDQKPLILLGIGVLIVAIVLVVLVVRPDLARKLIGLVVSRLPVRFRPRITEGADHALQGLAPLSNPRVSVQVGLWSMATWMINMVTVYFMLLAFNLEVTPIVAIVLVVVTNLSMAIPSAPGYVGVFEYSVFLVLTALGQPVASSQAFAVIYHFVGLVPVAILGVIGALQLGLNFTALRGNDEPKPPTDIRPIMDDRQTTSISSK